MPDLAGTLHQRVALHVPIAAVELFAELTGEGRRPGAVLLESADMVAPGGRRSLVLAHPTLRLTLRGSVIRVEALDLRGESLLDEVIARIGGTRDTAEPRRVVTATAPESDTDPSHDDGTRLRSPSALDVIRSLSTLVPDDGAPVPAGMYGAINYEIVDRFETLPPRQPDPLDEPDLHMVYALDGIAIDHLAGEAHIVVRTLAGEGSGAARLEEILAAFDRVRANRLALHGVAVAAPLPTRAAVVKASKPQLGGDPDAFEAGVRTVLGHIAAGDVFQLVLSRTLEVESALAPLDAYRRLRTVNPSPYLFYIDLPDGVLLGASPETAVKVTKGIVELRPIAGTVRRGEDEDADARLALSLILDPKEQAEHVMLVDLARNDVARISVTGSRTVEGLMQIERYSHVQHLTSRVRGTLRAEFDALHAYRACANMGTLTGSPKIRAMELIRGLESTARGFYGGAVGYLTAGGDLDTCICIRAMRWKDGVYRARAGAGIVADSQPVRELDETTAKARACLSVLS